MNARIQKVGVAALLMLFVLVGCGGSSGGDNNPPTITDNPAEDTHYPGGLFEDIDEVALLNNPPSNVVKTISNNALIDITPTTAPKVEVSSSDIISEASDGSFITLKISSNIDQASLNQPLFVEGVFKGIVNDVQNSATDIKIGLRYAEEISEVYDSFDITFRNDEFRNSAIRALNRSVAKRRLGRYDHLNENPLEVTIIDKQLANNSRSMTSNEVVLRIDIPKGYHIPARDLGLKCSFSEIDCTMTMQFDKKNKTNLGTKHSQSGITFSTEGSYIEIGLGSYIKARYDKNILSTDLFEFEIAQSTYFESNISVSVSGELSSSWSTHLDLLYDFEVEIAHPYSLVAKTSVIIDPSIILGIDGKMKGTLSASSKLNRSGEIRFKYSSTNDTKEESNNIKYTPKNITEDGVSVSIEAEGHAYIMPALTMLPSLKFLRVNVPITFVFIRSGIKLDNEIKGVINPNFVVESSGNVKEGSGTTASLTTTLYGLVQGRWFVRAAGIDFYHTKDYKDLFKTGALNIIEWKTQLLNNPQIIIEDHIAGRQKKNITFSIDADKKIEPHIYYYYAVGDESNPPANISAQNIENHPLFWKPGDDLISIDSNSIVKVRAVLYNEDVSTSSWSWGTSVSQQKEFNVIDIATPIVTPYSQSFKDELGITIEQHDGFGIYYRLNNSPPMKYNGPFMISEDTTVVAYVSDFFNGTKVQSETVTHTYKKCASNELLEESECRTTDSGENVVNIVASDNSATEGTDDNAAFTVTRTGDISEALVVTYLIGGTADPGDDYIDDYIWGDVTIPAGFTSTDIFIVPINNGIQEETETVTFTIITNSQAYSIGTQNTATIDIYELSRISVVATDKNASESGDSGEFTVTRSGDTNEALTVYFTLMGSATLNSDYTSSSVESITFSAGIISKNISITPINDGDPEGIETVILTIIENSEYVVTTPGSDNVLINEQSKIYNTDIRLHAVWAWSNDSAVAAGDYSSAISGYKIYHYNDNNWSESIAELPDYGRIVDLWGTSNSDIYAVTQGVANYYEGVLYYREGEILHYDGASWSVLSVTSSKTGDSYTSVWGTNSTNIYVTGIWSGSVPFVYKFDGFGWVRESLDNVLNWELTPNDIHGNTSGSTYIAAEYSVLKLNGTNWMEESVPIYREWTGIWVAPDNHVFTISGTMIAHYDPSNDEWNSRDVKELVSAEGMILTSKVWGITSSNVYVLANIYANGKFSSNLLLYYDGTSWSEKSLPEEEKNVYFSGISGVDDLFIVGIPSVTGGGRVIIHHVDK